MIWEGLLNSIKGSIDESAYENFKQTFDNLGQTYEQSVNLQQLPQSIEELNKLDPATKQALLEDLFQGEEVVDPTQDQELATLIQNRKKEFDNEKYEDFKSGWAIFLSNQQVQDEFIKTLKSAKYLTPTTKQYIRDFINRADITDDAKSRVNQALEEVSNSPVEELLSNMVTTLQENGIDTTGMITDLSKFMSDLANSSNIENFSYSPEMDSCKLLLLTILCTNQQRYIMI